MTEGPNIARIGAVLGDNARSEVLSMLMAGCAYTATELADAAGVTRQTISFHLGKLMDAGLVLVERQGRHRYFRLAGGDVAHLLESLMGIAANAAPSHKNFGPRDPAMRKARICYDHLAGELGVAMYEGMLRNGLFKNNNGGLSVTQSGHRWFEQIGIDIPRAAARKRTFCRECMDWSERRNHLAGSLGAALLVWIQEMGWAKRVSGSRTILFTDDGEERLHKLFAQQNFKGLTE